MMEFCEFFATEGEAIAACREVNRGLNSKARKGDRLLYR
jgi:hypothetical protein